MSAAGLLFRNKTVHMAARRMPALISSDEDILNSGNGRGTTSVFGDKTCFGFSEAANKAVRSEKLLVELDVHIVNLPTESTEQSHHDGQNLTERKSFYS